MKSPFDSQKVEITCPQCQTKRAHEIARLRGNAQITCPACSAVIAVDGTQLDQELRAAERQLADLSKSLGKTLKIKL